MAVKLVLAAAAAAALAVGAQAQVVADPNQIVGTIQFTNGDPAILALLGDPGGEGMVSALVTASSQPPAVRTTHVTTVPSQSWTQATYELTVEASAAGTAYRAWPRLTCGANGNEICFPAGISSPVMREPSPDVTLDFSGCVAVLQIRFVDEGGAPVTVRDVQLTYSPSATGASCGAFASIDRPISSFNMLVPSGRTNDRLAGSYVINFAPMRVDIPFPAGCSCDSVTDVPIVVPPLTLRTGGVTGRFDLLGVSELARQASESIRPMAEVRGGPFNSTHRWYWPVGVEPVSVPFDVQGVVAAEDPAGPPEHEVGVGVTLDTPGRYTSVSTPTVAVRVDEGVTTDVGDTFVITPGWFEGSLSFAGPVPSGSNTPLLDLTLETTSLTDRMDAAVFDLKGIGETVDPLTHGTRGSVQSALVGDYDATSGRYDANVRFPVPSLAGVPGPWKHYLVAMWFRGDAATDGRFVDAHLDINDFTQLRQPPTSWIGPGDVQEYSASYCLSEVTVEFSTTSGTFFAPNLNGLGTRPWADFEGRNPAFQALCQATGSPTIIDEAASTGSVVLPLPEGNWHLYPEMTMVNPGSGTSHVELPDFYLRVGCREHITVRPEIQIEMEPRLPSCSPGQDVTVTGEARATDGLARVFYTVNGGPETDLCVTCGTTYPYSATIPLGADVTLIRVTAVSLTGLVAFVEGRTSHLPELSPLDINPLAQPLRVSRAANGDLRIEWEASTLLANLHAGTIESLGRATYDHAAVLPCSRVRAEALVPLPSVDTYFLVGADCGSGDGSLGRDSFGRERPPGTGCP